MTYDRHAVYAYSTPAKAEIAAREANSQLKAQQRGGEWIVVPDVGPSLAPWLLVYRT